MSSADSNPVKVAVIVSPNSKGSAGVTVYTVLTADHAAVNAYGSEPESMTLKTPNAGFMALLKVNTRGVGAAVVPGANSSTE